MLKTVLGIGLAAALTAATATGAWAGWGCGFSAPVLKGTGKFGSVWAEDTEQAARDAALQLCAKSFEGCYIVACKAGIDTQDKAHALWPLNGPQGDCFGSGCR